MAAEVRGQNNEGLQVAQAWNALCFKNLCNYEPQILLCKHTNTSWLGCSANEQCPAHTVHVLVATYW